MRKGKDAWSKDGELKKFVKNWELLVAKAIFKALIAPLNPFSSTKQG